MAMPDFLIIGAPKTGSTALHVALAHHPQLFLSPIKEPKFFLTDGPPPAKGGPGDARTFRQYVWRRADYEALFEHAPSGTLRGESTTLYLGDPQAHRRIAAAVPGVRLIAVLRDPVDRAHSNWTHLFGAGLEPEPDFLAACKLEAGRLARGWAPFWGYTKLGKYGEQLTSLFEHFDREQVLLLNYRDLRNSPSEALDRVCAHLGVETGVVRQISPENVTAAISPSPVNSLLRRGLRIGAIVGDRFSQLLPESLGERISGPAVRLLQREQRRRTPLTPDEHACLMPTFEADIVVLEELLGTSYAHWRDATNANVRQPLRQSEGKFGTGYRSINRPGVELH